MEAVKGRQTESRGRPLAALVISMGWPRTRFSRQINSALAELGLPILRGRTTKRGVCRCGREGKSVLDGRDRVAKAGIIAICDEVVEMCDDLSPKTPIAP